MYQGRLVAGAVITHSLKRFKVVVLCLMLALLCSAAAKALFFTNVCIVTGTIQFLGRPADKGLPLTAFIGEDKITEVQTQDNGNFELRIPEYDPSRPDIKGYRSIADVIQVKLNGRNAKPTFSPTADNLKIDLRVETTLDVRLSTWGKIKALFK